jgi:hypothetical protein
MITNNVYVKMKSGLGNMLFQIAAGIHFATKYNKQFIINENIIIPSYHRLDKVKLVNILRELFPNLLFTTELLYTHNDKYNSNTLKKRLESYNDDKLLSNLYDYREPSKLCFSYLGNNIDPYIKHYDNIILHGYFINYNYLIDNNIFNEINIQPHTKELLNINFENMYFIHIRLGDYINNSLHYINLQKYYNYCIEKIKYNNKKAQFYICTNSYNDILTEYLNNLPITNYILQDKNNNDVDTLYIMSSCIGGICANSTLSFIGSYFQKNKTKKNIYMPYPIVNFVNGFSNENVTKDMYPDWCTIYNTFNNEINNFDYIIQPSTHIISKRPKIVYISDLGDNEKPKHLPRIDPIDKLLGGHSKQLPRIDPIDKLLGGHRKQLPRIDPIDKLFKRDHSKQLPRIEHIDKLLGGHSKQLPAIEYIDKLLGGHNKHLPRIENIIDLKKSTINKIPNIPIQKILTPNILTIEYKKKLPAIVNISDVKKSTINKIPNIPKQEVLTPNILTVEYKKKLPKIVNISDIQQNIVKTSNMPTPQTFDYEKYNKLIKNGEIMQYRQDNNSKPERKIAKEIKKIIHKK